YTTTPPPTPPQLKFASTYFRASAPTFLFSAAHFRSFPPSPHPEVAFLGRSNVGKSSLLNALFGRTNAKPARVSSRPGRTKTMNGFGISGGAEMGAAPRVMSAEGAAVRKEEVWKRFPAGGVVVVDMPGYGSGSREDWGTEALKVLERRRQLRRTFVLVDAEHGLKGSDLQLLTHLARQGIAFTILLSKVDKVLWTQGGKKEPGRMALDARLTKLQGIMDNMRQQVDAEVGGGNGRRYVGDILCCSAEKMLGRQQHDKLGVDEIRWAVLSACGME
ncbi:P-loop containing nucleoside triphosphate hydrolase protein, partial [Neohortaea acidophila]